MSLSDFCEDIQSLLNNKKPTQDDINQCNFQKAYFEFFSMQHTNINETLCSPKFTKGVKLADINNFSVTNCVCLYLLLIWKLMLLRSMAAPATKGDIKTIFEKLDKISRSLVDNSSSLAQLTEEIRELKKSQKFLTEQNEVMKEKLQWKDKEVKDFQAENRSLKEQVQKLGVRSHQTEEDVNDPEQYGRRECLEFQGLAWKENVECGLG